jgi:hypothetical protein
MTFFSAWFFLLLRRFHRRLIPTLANGRRLNRINTLLQNANLLKENAILLTNN